MSSTMSGFAVLLVFLVLSSLAVTSAQVTPTGLWSFCGVLQSNAFISITSALLSSNTTTPLQYGAQAQAFYAVAGPSCTGYRLFYNLTQGSSPVLQQNDSIVSLAAPGSTGGNTNYFFPYSTPELDGDGLTFSFSSIPLIDGQGETAASGASPNMNFWFTQNEYFEETAGGTHQNAAWASSLSIVPVPLGTTQYPTCTAAPTIQWSFCYYLVSSAFSVVFSGTLTSTGVAQPFAATSSNQLTQTQQGLSVINATGTRVYINKVTGAMSTLTVVSLAPYNTIAGNENFLYPAGPRVTDWNGIGFVMNGSVPINGQSSTGRSLVFWYQQAVGEYLEETASGTHEATPTASNFQVLPYSPYTNGPTLSCALPTFPVLGQLVYFTFCSQLGGPTWTAVMSGLLTGQNFPYPTGPTDTAYLMTNAIGTRTYTNLTTGQVTVNTIVGLAAVGQTGSNDNLVYINASLPIIDGDGLTFIFDAEPPIAGQATPVNGTNQLNWFASGSAYLEETAGGTHESTPTLSVGILTVASAGAAIPSCYIPLNASLAAGAVPYSVCSVLVGTTYTSTLSAEILVNAAPVSGSSTPAYLAINGSATGSRVYNNLVNGTTQYTIITALDAPGSTGGNDNVRPPHPPIRPPWYLITTPCHLTNALLLCAVLCWVVWCGAADLPYFVPHSRWRWVDVQVQHSPSHCRSSVGGL